MSTKLSIEQIRDYWTNQALEHGRSPSASWSDHRVIEMETVEILKRLNEGDRVLDVGCANGFSTIQFAIAKNINIRGLDYIPEMIEQARLNLQSPPAQLAGTAEFDTGNIMGLNEPSDSYDKVVVIRVVINLANWENQQKALQECVRVLKPGGMLLLSEATIQGWTRLNALRSEWGLPEIPMPGFNHYLDEELVSQSVAPAMELVETVNFASTYFVGTRVLKPLLAKALGASIDTANPNAEWNRWFSTLPAGGDYGTQKLLVFRKK